MKLMVCRRCDDVVKLRDYERKCECGKARGQYDAQGRGVIRGPGMAIAFSNFDYPAAQAARHKTKRGAQFTAWFIEKGRDVVNRK